MANVRWNFRLGPLQFSSPVGVISVGLVVLCCCGAGIAGKFMDDPSPPAVPAVETPAPATSAAVPSAKPTKTAAKAKTVSPGAFCHTVGDAGVTKGGTPMVCKGPGDLRWRRR